MREVPSAGLEARLYGRQDACRYFIHGFFNRKNTLPAGLVRFR